MTSQGSTASKWNNLVPKSTFFSIQGVSNAWLVLFISKHSIQSTVLVETQLFLHSQGMLSPLQAGQTISITANQRDKAPYDHTPVLPTQCPD